MTAGLRHIAVVAAEKVWTRAGLRGLRTPINWPKLKATFA